MDQAARQNRVIAAGVLGAAVVGYWYYRKSNAHNLGDAVGSYHDLNYSEK